MSNLAEGSPVIQRRRQMDDISSGSHLLNGANRRATGVSPIAPEFSDSLDILEHLRSGQLLMVNSRRRNGLILLKQFHAEFAGPGAAVGSFFDEDCQRVISVGNLSLLFPTSHEERQTAYKIRRQWIRLTEQFTGKPEGLQRAQGILNQFETYFDQETVSRIPDEAFAMLVGVLPHTVRMARRPPGQLNVKVKN
jgi:hypothetical protein